MLELLKGSIAVSTTTKYMEKFIKYNNELDMKFSRDKLVDLHLCLIDNYQLYGDYDPKLFTNIGGEYTTLRDQLTNL